MFYTVSKFIIFRQDDSKIPGWVVFDIADMQPVVYGLPTREDAVKEWAHLTITGELSA